MSTTATSEPVFQEVDGTVIYPPTFIKELAFPANINLIMNVQIKVLIAILKVSCIVAGDREIMKEKKFN